MKHAPYVIGNDEGFSSHKAIAIRQAQKLANEQGEQKEVYRMNWDKFGVAWPEKIATVQPRT